MNRKNYNWIWWVIIIIVILGVLIFTINSRQAASKLSSYSQFKKDLDDGKVTAVYGVSGYRFNVVTTSGSSEKNGKSNYDYFFTEVWAFTIKS